MQHNIVDLHTHVLPLMDDGSTSTEMSVELLARLREQGVATVCCTSHYYANRETIEEFSFRRQKAKSRLLAQHGERSPKLLVGAETAWFPHISRCDLSPLCLEGTRMLLLEMPFSNWCQQETEEVISLVLDHGYQLVLAHPERFCFSKSNRTCLERLAELPIGFQINADTLLRWSTRGLALELLELTRYPLLGSDTHNLTSRPPRLAEARKVIGRKLGEDFLEYMDENAAAAVSGCGWEG